MAEKKASIGKCLNKNYGVTNVNTKKKRQRNIQGKERRKLRKTEETIKQNERERWEQTGNKMARPPARNTKKIRKS